VFYYYWLNHAHSDLEKTGPNELTAVWGDRDNEYVNAVRTSAGLVWQDPTEFESIELRKLHRHISGSKSASYWDGSADDLDYATFVQTGSNLCDVLSQS
jgi:hypothetical protein